MIDDNSYTRYKYLKENFDFRYNGYFLKYIIATDIVYRCFGKVQKINRSLLKSSLFKTYDLSILKKKLTQGKVLFTFSSAYGKDYQQLLDTIMSEVEKPVLLNNDLTLKSIFSYKNILTSFWQVFFLRLRLKIPFKEKFFYFLRLTFHKNFIDEIEKYASDIKISKFVPFLSSINQDTVYCQFFRRYNIPSYAIQHGTHCSKTYFKKFIPLDVVNIENFQADYMLGWGLFTKESLLSEGFSEKTFVLAGNPKYSKTSSICVQNTFFKKCVINLARDLYFEENLRLLEISASLQKEGIEIFIKMHPRSDLAKYTSTLEKHSLKVMEKTTVLSSVIETIKPDFVIVYNSTVYYEYYINNTIAFRFSLNENEIPFGIDDSFELLSELKEKINEFKNKDNNLLNEEVNKMVNRFCALGVNNYGKILN